LYKFKEKQKMGKVGKVLILLTCFGAFAGIKGAMREAELPGGTSLVFNFIMIATIVYLGKSLFGKSKTEKNEGGGEISLRKNGTKQEGR